MHPSGLPKVDTIYFKAYPGASPDTVVEEFLACETDWIEGPGRGDLYQDVIDAGQNVSPMNNMSEFTFAPINGRDYKYTSGDPNAPLNHSAFRLALSYIYGMDDKDTDVSGYYGVPWFSALGNPVPPAQQPWYDEATQMPNTDYPSAWGILTGAGYSIADYGGQQWLHKDGVPVRPPDGPNSGEIVWLYSTGAEVYPQGPGGGMVRNYNDFIVNYTSAEGPLMRIAPTDFPTLVTDLLATRDYDIIGIGLTNLGLYVDWIFDCFHSDNDVPWGWNFVGAHDDDYDRWAEIILTDMDPARIQEACENWTRKFVNERMDWFPLITGQDFCTTKVEPGIELTNVISMENYGPRNDWSWQCMHWNGTPGVVWPGGSYIAALGDAPHSMNPWTEDTLYGWNMMDRCYASLRMLNPETLKPMPFVATDWYMANWTSIPELGIEEGATASFWLRQDVLWHDWECQYNDRLDQTVFPVNPVDAFDCVYNMRFMRQEHPGRYSGTWAHLVYEEADGPFKFNVYFDQTSLYYPGYVSGTSLLMPEHVGEEIESYWETWAPCDGGINECTYDDLMGQCQTGQDCPPSYPYLKQLVGNGPFVFRYYDRSLAVGQDERFNEFFVNSPVECAVVGEWRIDPDSDYEYEVMIENCGGKEWTNEGEVATTTVDVAIYEDDVWVRNVNDTTLDPWEVVYLPGSKYIWPNVPCPPCVHTIKVIVIGPNFRDEYVHKFVTTIREDVTTYCGDVIDCQVDMRDVGRAARGFGSYPGHPRWDPCCDVNDDFKVDMRDIGAVARRFGWHC
jgi:hypothetical protein